MAGEMRVLVWEENNTRKTAVLMDGRLMEYHQEQDAKHSLVGSVLLGRVERVLPAMNAAFVQIGQSKNGFLPLTEMESFSSGDNAKPLVSGQEIIVQVKKDAKGDKGAFLSRDIALAGQYGILMPLNHHIGVSSRVTDAKHREYALALGKEITGSGMGMIVRHAALAAQNSAILTEFRELTVRWENIITQAPFLKAPAVLYGEPSVLQGILRDYASRHQITLLCTEAVAAEGQAPNERVAADPKPHSGERGVSIMPHTQTEMEAAWQGARIHQQVEEALCRQVPLAEGGTLVIDEREALTTIDVNTARFVGEKSGKGFALEQNVAACPDIAWQIRLRNLSGILLIDFIDMKTDEHRAQVQEILQAHLSDDRVKTVIHGFTSLGLLEMTRKRTRESLRDMLAEPCAACKGNGYRMATHRQERKSGNRKGQAE